MLFSLHSLYPRPCWFHFWFDYTTPRMCAIYMLVRWCEVRCVFPWKFSFEKVVWFTWKQQPTFSTAASIYYIPLQHVLGWMEWNSRRGIKYATFKLLKWCNPYRFFCAPFIYTYYSLSGAGCPPSFSHFLRTHARTHASCEKKERKM